MVNRFDLGPCSPSTEARVDVGGRVGEQVDLNNSKMEMLTVQEESMTRRVSPKIARLMSRFEHSMMWKGLV